MWEDTIVEEVREVRARHAEKFNFDLWLIYQDLKEQERLGQRKLVTFLPRPRVQRAMKKRQPQIVPDVQPVS